MRKQMQSSRRAPYQTIILMFALTLLLSAVSCWKSADNRTETQKKEKQTVISLHSQYPYANDNRVYTLSDGGILQQWSNDGKKIQKWKLYKTQAEHNKDHSLLWVGNDEIIWCRYASTTGGVLYSTPISRKGTNEQVIMDGTRKLFSFDLDFIGDIAVSDNYIYYTDSYSDSLYLYDRQKAGDPKEIKDVRTCLSQNAISLASQSMGDSLCVLCEDKEGSPYTDEYILSIYHTDSGSIEKIADGCFPGCICITDSSSGNIYYQTAASSDILQYNSRTQKKKEFISDETLQECYEKNGLLWDEPYYNDRLLFGKNAIYLVKNVDYPLLFCYSLQDGSLTYAQKLTETIHKYGYTIYNNAADIQSGPWIVDDKLLLSRENDDLEKELLCINIPNAEAKYLTDKDAEMIYVKMLKDKLLDDDIDTVSVVKQAKKTKESPAGHAANRNRQLPSPSEQLQCIARQKDLFLKYLQDDGIICEGASFAVTDLDHNGRLEVILSVGPNGSGVYTTRHFFEVNADATSLRRILDYTNIESDNDINTAYYDESSNQYYYLTDDYVSGGYGARYIAYAAMLLSNGRLTDCIYADAESTLDKKEDKEVYRYYSYIDGTCKKIKKKEFDPDGLSAKWFSGLNKKQVTISWIQANFKLLKSEKQLLDKLTKSYQNFQVR